MAKDQQVNITRVNISWPKGCQVAEPCNEPAYWILNSRAGLCEKHFKIFCEAAGIDHKAAVAEIKENWGK